MKRFRILLEMPTLCLMLAGVLAVGAHAVRWDGGGKAPTAELEIPEVFPQDQVARIALTTYCGGCHQSGRSGFDINEESMEPETMRHHRSEWEQVVKKLKSRKMPPRKHPQPTEEEREAMIAWINQEVLDQPAPTTTGKVMARRLQRSEYINTVAALLEVRFEPGADFPRDEREWRRYDAVPELPARLAGPYRAAAEAVLASAQAQPDRPPLFAPDCSTQTPAAAAREILSDFSRRAFRKPVESADVDRFFDVYERAEKDGKSFEDGIKAALLEVLTSPHFVYRIEFTDAAPSDAFALASRLSYFLWRSTPDAELLELAEQGVLESRLEEQVKRMLQDPRSRGLAVDFTGSWLSLDKLNGEPMLEDSLRSALRQETEHFAAAILADDRSVLEFLDADYTYVNEVLAKHYGIAGVQGDAFRRVGLQGTPRGGLLTQGSFLRITSRGEQTSPVNRGKWVLENLLGAAPIRPPAGLIQALQESPTFGEPGAPRKQLAAHRTNPSCAQCHVKMDAIGMSLENFDANGAWRNDTFGTPIDPVGDLPDGETLHGVPALKAYLLNHRDQFTLALGEKLLGFALGRKLDERDRTLLTAIPQNAAKHDYRFSRIILDVVQSEPFRVGYRELSD